MSLFSAAIGSPRNRELKQLMQGHRVRGRIKIGTPHCGGLASCLVLEPRLLFENMCFLHPPWGPRLGGGALSPYKTQVSQCEPTLWVLKWEVECRELRKPLPAFG